MWAELDGREQLGLRGRIGSFAWVADRGEARGDGGVFQKGATVGSHDKISWRARRLATSFHFPSHRPVPRNLRLEIAQADPLGPLVEIDFRDGDAAPLLALRNHLAGVVEHGRDHPVAGYRDRKR